MFSVEVSLTMVPLAKNNWIISWKYLNKLFHKIETVKKYCGSFFDNGSTSFNGIFNEIISLNYYIPKMTSKCVLSNYISYLCGSVMNGYSTNGNIEENHVDYVHLPNAHIYCV